MSAAAAAKKPILESRELREIANHLEQLCIASHQRYKVSVACEGCKRQAGKLRAYAATLDLVEHSKNKPPSNQPSHCEECGVELHQFAANGVGGVSCDSCGWSWP